MKAFLSREKAQESTSTKEQSGVEWREELVRIELQGSHRDQTRTRTLEIRIRALKWEKMGTVIIPWSAIILYGEEMGTITTSWSFIILSGKAMGSIATSWFY